MPDLWACALHCDVCRHKQASIPPSGVEQSKADKHLTDWCSIMQFAGMGLLKKAVFLAMVRTLPVDETQGSCCLFQALDNR